MKPIILQFGVVLLAQFSLAQATPPCAHPGEMLRDESGKTVRFTSAQMKTRATRKVDADGLMRSLDFRGTVLIETLISPTGDVACAKNVYGHPVVAAEVEKAVRKWKFKPVKKDGKPVASLGLLEFYLCNIGCGKEGMSMSLLK
jgi:Gram-negative bacterial TonB protein C-terminal